MTEAAGDGCVFISYSSQDADVAEKIRAALEAEGLRCWIAPRDVRAGQSYAAAIVEAINSCSMLLLVLSHAAIQSPHVLREVERASSKRRSVLSLRTDGSALPPDLEYFLSANHWLDASGGPLENFLPALLRSVRERIQPTSPHAVNAAAAATAGTRLTQPRPLMSRTWMVWIALAFLALVVVGGAVFNRYPGWRTSADHDSGGPGSRSISAKSIAVLPFVDMSEKGDQEYFGDGMADEILDLLAKIPGLTVIGRTSSFQFKGKNEDLRTIGAKLNAAYILEGSVRRFGDKVRITAQLINTQTAAQEWSETYDRQFGDVLKLQDEIALAVVRELQLNVDPGSLSPRSAVSNPAAYELFLKGRHAFDRYTKEGFEDALGFFAQAHALDSGFADSVAALASSYERQGSFAFVEPSVAFESARQNAQSALAIDPDNALAHLVMGRIHMLYDWDWQAAELELRTSRSLAPGSAVAIASTARLQMILGKCDEALRSIRAAISIDPLDAYEYEVMSNVQTCRGHDAEAEAAVRQLLAIRPGYDSAPFLLTGLLLARGDTEGALTEAGHDSTALALAYFAAGRHAEADAALHRNLTDAGDYYGVLAVNIAEAYAFRGQVDEALTWLERAYAARDPFLPMVKSDLLLRRLRGESRYKALLLKMNLPE